MGTVTESVVAQLRERDRIGFLKYGVHLEDTPCDILKLVQHAQEEAMDLACYLEVLKSRLESLTRPEIQNTTKEGTDE